MKTAKIIELERKRHSLMDEARALLAQFEGADEKRTRELEKLHDAALRALDHNGLDLDEARLEAAEDDVRASRRPSMGAGEATGVAMTASEEFAHAWSGEDRSGWQDAEGKPVRVLRNTDRFAPTVQRGVALGDTIRAMVTGPRNEAEKRALSEGTTTAGGYTVPAPLATWFIDRLRRQSVAIRAGAMTVPMTSQTLAIARLDTDPTIGWRAENASIAEGDPTFSRVLLTAKSLAGIVKFSRELMMDTVNAGAMIEQALAKAMALEIDRAAIYGDGSSDSPTGILATSGINSVSMGTNGATLASVGGYDKHLDALYELELDNVPQCTAMIMHPRTSRDQRKLKDGDGLPLIMPPALASIPQLVTTAASITETQGSSSVASSIVFGDFTQLFLGMREDINVRVLNERYADAGQVALLVHARMDVQLAHKESFCKLIGIIP